MGAVAAVGLTAISVFEQKRQAKKVERAQKEAAAVERAQQAEEVRKSRRQQIREARLRQAQIENQATASGQQGSSAAIAAGDSLQAQLGTNLGDISTAFAFNQARSTAEQNILDAGRPSDLAIAANAGLSLTSFFAPKSKKVG